MSADISIVILILVKNKKYIEDDIENIFYISIFHILLFLIKLYKRYREVEKYILPGIYILYTVEFV